MKTCHRFHRISSFHGITLWFFALLYLQHDLVTRDVLYHHVMYCIS